MKNKFSIKAFWLIALLLAGITSANAQIDQPYTGLTVSGNDGSSCICMGTNGSYQVQYDEHDGYKLKDATWTKVGGGIDIVPAGFIVNVTTQNDTTYNTQYSRYSKGRLRVDCLLEKEDSINVRICSNDSIPKDTTILSRSYKEVSMLIDICKQFDYPYQGQTNSIVGPECVADGEKVTYSIAPWVSLKDANKIGFDNYDWKNAPEEVYYSSDKSSITFTVNEDFLSHKTLSVSMGVCNGDTISRTLGIKPVEPILMTEKGDTIDWNVGLCLPPNAGRTTITIANPSTNASVDYIWDEVELKGWEYTIGENELTFTPLDARSIKLIVNSPCEEKVYTLKIKNAFTAGSSTITNDAETPSCLKTGEKVVFNVSDFANGTPMTWALEEGKGWSFYDSPTKAEPTIVVGYLPCRITVTDDCGNSIDSVFSVQPNTPKIIESNECIDAGDTITAITLDLFGKY